MNANRSNTHADPPLGSRWAQMWGPHVGTHFGNIHWYSVTKGNTYMQSK